MHTEQQEFNSIREDTQRQANNSNTNFKRLTEEQKIKLLQNLQWEKVMRGRYALQLGKKLEKTVDFGRKENDVSRDFLDDA